MNKTNKPVDNRIYICYLCGKPIQGDHVVTVSYTHLDVYKRQLLDCLEQCPDDLYADKKAVKRIGEIERRIARWDG